MTDKKPWPLCDGGLWECPKCGLNWCTWCDRECSECGTKRPA